MEKELQLPEHVNFMCIEGVIGVGKTTLCDMLARRFNLRPVYEMADENPFITSFYRDRATFAFQTQLWFLLSRYRQLSSAWPQQELFHRGAVADYLFAKDKLFATLNLDENEMALYNSVAQFLEPAIPRPDFVVYLQASTDMLFKRIEKRGRRYERTIDHNYIEALNRTYNHFFFHYVDTPLLIINTNDMDFVNEADDFEDVVTQIVNARSGTQYYHPVTRRRSSGPEGEAQSLL